MFDFEALFEPKGPCKLNSAAVRWSNLHEIPLPCPCRAGILHLHTPADHRPGRACRALSRESPGSNRHHEPNEYRHTIRVHHSIQWFAFQAVHFSHKHSGKLTNFAPWVFYGTNRAPNLAAANFLQPGAYQTEPYAC